MRAQIVIVIGCVLAATGCSPDIESGAYDCGPEQACPPDQICNGSDNTCVNPVTAVAFACQPDEEHEPDNTPAQGTPITGLGCVSINSSQAGCLAAGDTADWFKFSTPSGCAAVAVQLRVQYPVAFEPIGIILGDANGQLISYDTSCTTAATTAGDDVRCLTQTLSTTTDYTVEVMPAGGGDCNGTCNFNRYTLSLQLVTPE